MDPVTVEVVQTGGGGPGGELVPSVEASPVFREYRDKSWLWVTTATAIVTLFGLTATTIFGLWLGGAAGLLGGVFAGVGSGLWAGLRMSATANRGLRRRLRRTLGVRGRGIFVGLRIRQDDLWAELHRKETDDNVGFLELGDDAMSITSEAGKVSLPRGDVRGFERETVKAVPMLWFIRVLVDVEGQDGTFLLVSREGDSLRAQAEATRILYERLVGWHAEHQLAWLETHRDDAP